MKKEVDSEPEKKLLTTPKHGEKVTLRFSKQGQKAALVREAKKNMRSLNAELLFRLFGEEK